MLHLFDYNRFVEDYEAPAEVTQSAIAEGARIVVPHFGQYVRPLIAEGSVQEKTSHIKRKARRAKVYFLTAQGVNRVASLRNALLRETVLLRSPSGELAEVPLSRVYHEERRGSSLLALVAEERTLGHILATASATVSGIVDFSQDAPVAENFYGREEELRTLSRAVEEVPLIVVIGVPGIGKSALAAKLCEIVREKRSLFWRRVRPWDTATDLALPLASFLKALDRGHLHGRLSTSGFQDVGRIEEILTVDLAGIGALLVFDDVHEATESAQMFLSLLFHSMRRQKGSCGILLSRVAPTFYSRQEAVAERSVAEMFLKGLDLQSSVAFLADAGITPSLATGILEAAHGNPLFLRLLARTVPSEGTEAGWRTLEMYIAEEVEPSLAGDELECMQLASFYRVPVPPAALLLGEVGSTKAIVSLQRKGLLESVGGDRLAIHDFLRDYFQRGLALTRKRLLAERVAVWLFDAANQADDIQAALALAKNSVAVEGDSGRRLLVLESLGKLLLQAGNWQAAIETFRTALAEASDPFQKARLRERTAQCYLQLQMLEDAAKEIESGMTGLPQGPSFEAGMLRYAKAYLACARRDFDDAWVDVEAISGWTDMVPRSDLWWRYFHLRGLLYLTDPGRKNVDRAETDFRTALDLVRGERFQEQLPTSELGIAAFERGRSQEGLAYLDRALDIAKRTGHMPWVNWSFQFKAWHMAGYMGDYDAAEELYLEAYRGAKNLDWPHVTREILRALAELYWLEGRYQEARESMEQYVSSQPSYRNVKEEALFLAEMVRYCLACRDGASAETYLGRLEKLAESAPSKTSQYFVEWARGVVLVHRGAVNEAEKCLRQARELELSGGDFLDGFSSMVGLSGAAGYGGPRHEFIFDYARVLVATGKANEAKQALTEASQRFRMQDRKPLEKAAATALSDLKLQ